MKEQLSRRERKQNLFSFKSERFVAATPETVLTRFCTPEDIKKKISIMRLKKMQQMLG